MSHVTGWSGIGTLNDPTTTTVNAVASGVLGAAVSASLSLGIATIALNLICRRWTGVDPSILVLFRFPRWKAKARPAAAADPNV